MEPEEIIGDDVNVIGVESVTDERVIQYLENIDLNVAQMNLYIQELNDSVNVSFPVWYDTARVLLAYGFVYVPLTFVVIMLWWFFKQFIQKY